MLIPIDGSHNINVTYTDKWAHISNDSLLSTAINACGVISVANAVIIYYQRNYRKDLNISTNSMAVEINGHVFPDKVLRAVVDSPYVPTNIKIACQPIMLHTFTIDAGESSVDNNRWIWDGIAAVTQVLPYVLYPI